MPLYEYQCDACSHRFEVIQKFSDAPVTVCPKCGGAVQKLFSSPAFQFKGSGWYITDYARKSEGSGASKSESSGGASKTTASGDAKPSGSTSSDSSAASGSGTSTPPSPAPKAAS